MMKTAYNTRKLSISAAELMMQECVN